MNHRTTAATGTKSWRTVSLAKAEAITHDNATSDARGQTTMAEKKIQTNSKIQEIHGISLSDVGGRRLASGTVQRI